MCGGVCSLIVKVWILLYLVTLFMTMLGHGRDTVVIADFSALEEFEPSEKFPVQDLGVALTLILEKNGKFLQAYDPEVRKHLELRFVLSKNDYHNPLESKNYWFATKECTLDEFLAKEHFKEAKEKGITYYCPDWASNSEIKKEDIALFGTVHNAVS